MSHPRPKDKPKPEQPCKNQLEQRINDLLQLLLTNNSQFVKGIPSEAELKRLLQHSSHCYDQLDHITREYSVQYSLITIPKNSIDDIHKIMKTNKNLLQHLQNWIGGFSSDVEKRVRSKHTAESESSHFNNTCKLCQNHVEEVLLKEAKKEILGPSHWKDLFEEELLNERKDEQRQEQCRPDLIEYRNSVNYLSKVIKDMEQSIQGYIQVEKMEKAELFETEPAFYLLEELFTKMKNKMGEKCIPKMNEILRNEIRKNITGGHSNPAELKILEQYNMFLGTIQKPQLRPKRLTGSPEHEAIIEKLEQENRKLMLQKNVANQLYHSRFSIQTALDNHKNKSQQSKRRNSYNNAGKTLKLNSQALKGIKMNELTTIPAQVEPAETPKNQQTKPINEQEMLQELELITPQPRKKKANNHIKRMSVFNPRHSQKAHRQSEISCMMDLTIEEDENEVSRNEGSESEASYPENESESNQNDELNDEDLDNLNQVGCQWDINDFMPLSLQNDVRYSIGDDKTSKGSEKQSDSKDKQGKSKKKSRLSKVSAHNFTSKKSIRENTSKKNIKPKDSERAEEVVPSSRFKNKLINENITSFSKNKSNKLAKKVKTGTEKLIPEKDHKPPKQVKATEYPNIPKHDSYSYKYKSSHFKTENNHEERATDSLAMISSEKESLDMETHNINSFAFRNDNLSQKMGQKENQLLLNIKSTSNIEGIIKKADGGGMHTGGRQRHTLGFISKEIKKETESTDKLQPIRHNKSPSPLQHSQNPNQMANGPRESHHKGIDNDSQARSSHKSKNTSRFKTHQNQKSSTHFKALEYLNRNQHSSIAKTKESHNKTFDSINTRIASEGNERIYLKKSKLVRNFLFQPEHLQIFGGISESYNYQNLKCQPSESKFNQEEAGLLDKLLTYLSSLKGFKRSIYENIVFFLKNPFQAIEKSEFQFQPINNQTLHKIVLKLLVFHRRKCGSLHCCHLEVFSELIGFSLN